ncbi:divalent metal cation transporter [Patescibacteria group bacterium]|nr:divalent metal cation transporter [Patescibacteria group bacterium]
MDKIFGFIKRNRVKILLFISVFGPATITAMADNDAAGVATYAIAGAKLGYPILFALFWITILLGVTQEMGMRLSLVTRKGLADLIRENQGVKTSLVIFICLLIANMGGSIIVDVAAFKTTAEILHLPSVALMLFMLAFSFIFIIKGNYKLTQRIMLLSSLFYLAYIFSAFKSEPNWGLAFKNLAWPSGVNFTSGYWKDYIIIGLGVLGTTITPWGQFFISSFGLDKKIATDKLKYSQAETYWGAFVTDFFSFFMIVATAATLFIHHIAITDGTTASLAIKPFAGNLAAVLFALGIMNAGFMGIITVGLSTTYAFSEFFGLTGSLDAPFEKSRIFYTIFIIQLVVAFLVVLFPLIDLFKIAVAAQLLNSFALPPIFYFLIKYASNHELMGKYVNNGFQKWFAIVGTVIISLASIFTVAATIFKF